MSMLKRVFFIGIVLTTLSSCHSIIRHTHKFIFHLTHKPPRVDKDFELYNKAITDSLCKRYSDVLFVSEPFSYSMPRACHHLVYDSLTNQNVLRYDSLYKDVYYLLYDSFRILWANSIATIPDNEMSAKGFSSLIKGQPAYICGIAYRKDGNYGLQIDDGLNHFLYFDLHFLSEGKIKLILKEYKQRGKKIYIDYALQALLNKELTFSPIKIN